MGNMAGPPRDDMAAGQNAIKQLIKQDGATVWRKAGERQIHAFVTPGFQAIKYWRDGVENGPWPRLR